MNIYYNEKGMALVTTLLIAIVISVFVIGVHYAARIDINIAGNKRTAIETFYDVEGDNSRLSLNCKGENVTNPTQSAVLVNRSDGSYRCRYSFCRPFNTAPGYNIGITPNNPSPQHSYYYQTTNANGRVGITSAGWKLGPAACPN